MRRAIDAYRCARRRTVEVNGRAACGSLNSRWLQLAEERPGGRQATASQQPPCDCGDPDAAYRWEQCADALDGYGRRAALASRPVACPGKRPTTRAAKGDETIEGEHWAETSRGNASRLTSMRANAVPKPCRIDGLTKKGVPMPYQRRPATANDVVRACEHWLAAWGLQAASRTGDDARSQCGCHLSW